MTTSKLHKYFLQATGVSTDTRNIKSGNMFFALKGPSFNGNEFAEDALKKGASYAVIDEKSYDKGDRFLLVEDVLSSLQSLAQFHRKQFEGTVLALTGSNGKTTTKELINAVLSTQYETISTQGNLNNHIGVPLTLLRIRPSTEIAIIEMGANHLGEIQRLCEIAQPDAGLITNIGKAHIGTFGGYENILRGKSELYQYLIENEGTIWVNQEEAALMNMSKRMKSALFYPGKNSFCHVELVSSDPFLIVRLENGKEYKTRLIGEYNFPNVATALAVSRYFHVDAQKAMETIGSYSPTNNRSQFLETENNSLILDAYNANPSSMNLALGNFAKMKSSKQKLCILGDMFELGEEAMAEHRTVIETCNHHGFETLFVGENFYNHKNNFPSNNFLKNVENLITYLTNHKIQGKLILIKGSRGMKLETSVKNL